MEKVYTPKPEKGEELLHSNNNLDRVRGLARDKENKHQKDFWRK